MQIVKRDDATQVVDLPKIHLTTQELIEVIERTAGDKPVKLIIGLSFEETYTVLENIDEIKQFQSSISIPFSFEIDGTETTFRTYGARITFLRNNSAIASSLERRLSEFRPWYLFVFTWWFTPIWLVPLWVVLIGDYQIMSSKRLTWFILALWTLPALFSLFGHSYDRPRLHSKERQGFFKRNRDKILMLLISVIVGALVANFDKLFLSENEEPTLNRAIEK